MTSLMMREGAPVLTCAGVRVAILEPPLVGADLIIVPGCDTPADRGGGEGQRCPILAKQRRLPDAPGLEGKGDSLALELEAGGHGVPLDDAAGGLGELAEGIEGREPESQVEVEGTAGGHGSSMQSGSGGGKGRTEG